MPEEIDRMVTDSVTDIFYTTSELANENLRNFGHEESKIRFVICRNHIVMHEG
jgi:UDP-N-acetylglucosamine 2-epimerase (non-hydrolysing)